tara:strand:+ start:1140 stop:1631 length:492 start_codon:yes stop_codon:yes gene_type:complete
MKNIILSLLLIFPSLVKCQITSNIITESEFNNIKINNVTLGSIKTTNGKLSKVKNLFPISILQNTQQPDEDYYDYTYNGFTIGFSENEISAFEITNTNWNITIKGKTVTIGSHKDQLGSVFLNNQVGGEKSIVYQYCEGCNNFLSLYLDSNNLITKIIYIEQT